MLDPYAIFRQTQRPRVSDGKILPLLEGCEKADSILLLVWPQLGDFDSLEYAWWLQKEAASLQGQNIAVRAVGIGSLESGRQFCNYTGFPPQHLFVDRDASLHRQLQLYPGLALKVPVGVNLLLMCAGIGSPGTLREVFRGYRGDRGAPQLIDNRETVRAFPLPPLSGSTFRFAGGEGFQRPFELATLRLRNMSEVLGHWSTYVPDASYITQRGGTFWFDSTGKPLYEHRDPGILGFAANMSRPLDFLEGGRDRF